MQNTEVNIRRKNDVNKITLQCLSLLMVINVVKTTTLILYLPRSKLTKLIFKPTMDMWDPEWMEAELEVDWQQTHRIISSQTQNHLSTPVNSVLVWADQTAVLEPEKNLHLQRITDGKRRRRSHVPYFLRISSCRVFLSTFLSGKTNKTEKLWPLDSRTPLLQWFWFHRTESGFRTVILWG